MLFVKNIADILWLIWINGSPSLTLWTRVHHRINCCPKFKSHPNTNAHNSSVVMPLTRAGWPDRRYKAWATATHQPLTQPHCAAWVLFHSVATLLECKIILQSLHLWPFILGGRRGDNTAYSILVFLRTWPLSSWHVWTVLTFCFISSIFYHLHLIQIVHH